jgi:hypothetical protein
VPDLFIAGNDYGKKFVSDIAVKWGWNSVIDMGELNQSYILEAFAMVWIQYAFRFNRRDHAFKLLRK